MSVLILSSHTLFADGVASRLRQLLPGAELAIVDPRRLDAVRLIVAAGPSVVLIDGACSETALSCLPQQLLSLLPGLRIISLDARQPRVQVMTSEQRPAGTLQELLALILSATG